MKKLILLLAFAFIACTSNEKEQQIINPVVATCNIWGQIESRTTFLNPNGSILQQNDWRNINQPFYYSSRCSDNNTIVDYKRLAGSDSYVEYRTYLYKR